MVLSVLPPSITTTSVLSGAEYDAIFHFGSGNEEIKKIREERGLKGAIEWYEKQ